MANHLQKILDKKQTKSGGFSTEQINPELSEIIPEKLEDIESQINKLKSKMWEVSWYIGKRLIAINNKYLEGTKFLNIAEYAEKKFGFQRRTSYNLMFIANNFTLVHARAHGSKLRLLQPLDDNKRIEYLDWMQNVNPTFREIEEKIKSETQKSVSTKKEISLHKTRLTVDFKQMGITIKKERTDEFLKKLEKLILEFSS